MLAKRQPYRIASNPRGRAARKRRPAAKTRPRVRHSATTRNPKQAGSKPAKKRRTTPMAKRAKAKSTRRRRPTHAKANPQRTTRRRRPAAKNPHRRRHASRRNPSVMRAGSLAIDGATALVALVFARQAPQLLLQENNSGWVGYLGNVIATLLAGYGASKVAGPRAANAALIGGTCYTVSRILTEQLSPIGKYLSLTGVGDAAAATNLGTIDDQYFAFPNTYDSAGQPVIPQQIIDAARSGMPMQAAVPKVGNAYGG